MKKIAVSFRQGCVVLTLSERHGSRSWRMGANCSGSSAAKTDSPTRILPQWRWSIAHPSQLRRALPGLPKHAGSHWTLVFVQPSEYLRGNKRHEYHWKSAVPERARHVAWRHALRFYSEP
jgi:hypothetical protein